MVFKQFMDGNLQKTIATYNQIAPDLSAKSEPKLDLKELNYFLSQIRTGGYILDLGCGAGRDAAYILKVGFKVVGIDLSTGMLKEAKRLHPEIDTKLMDFRKMDFEDKTFDGIWANAALVHVPRSELEPTLKEISRVIKPKGIMLITLKKGSGSKWVKEALSNYKARFYSFYSQEELNQAYIGAGLKLIKYYERKSRKRKNVIWLVNFLIKLSS